VITIENNHHADCGKSPVVTREANSPDYFGYFENQYGEQWMVRIDRDAGRGCLRGGDIGWDTEISIVDDEVVGDCILGQEEVAWLTVCWMTATGRILNIASRKGLDAAYCDASAGRTRGADTYWRFFGMAP